jgi:hypothetical protein
MALSHFRPAVYGGSPDLYVGNDFHPPSPIPWGFSLLGFSLSGIGLADSSHLMAIPSPNLKPKTEDGKLNRGMDQASAFQKSFLRDLWQSLQPLIQLQLAFRAISAAAASQIAKQLH